MSAGAHAPSQIHFASAGDFIALLKPRVMSLVVFTALTGMVMTPGTLHPVLAFASLLCIAVGAGASGALNMWFDADIDAVMKRTQTRPIPMGHIDRVTALSFGLVLSIGSVLVLGLIANWLSAGLLAFTIFFYAVVYTMWLKRFTAQNIVIGGAAGAFPPVIGAAVMSGYVTLDSLFLFLIIFLWTPPHFWALALLKSDDYKQAGIPMLPVAEGRLTTRRQIFYYALLYVAALQLPWISAMLGYSQSGVGVLTMVTALVSGAIFLGLSFQILRQDDGPVLDQTCRRLFAYSILQLLIVFAALLADTAFMVHA